MPQFDDQERQLIREVIESDALAPFREKAAAQRSARRSELVAETHRLLSEAESAGKMLAEKSRSAGAAVQRAERALEEARSQKVLADAEWTSCSTRFEHQVARLRRQLADSAIPELAAFREEIRAELERLNRGAMVLIPNRDAFGNRFVPASQIEVAKRREDLTILLNQSVRDVAEWEWLPDEMALANINERRLEIEALSMSPAAQ